MTPAKNYIFPLVLTSMFYPLHSNPNSLRLKVSCPSTWTQKISTGTDVRIKMERHPSACTALEKFGVLRDKSLDNCSEPSVLNADIQVIHKSKTVSITWVQQHTDNKCYSDEIFLLDVEQRMRDVDKSNTFYISNWCFQFQIESGSPKIKESVSYSFDCIETIPETEAYLIKTTLWSLPGKSLSSSDERDCGRSECYRLKEQMKIGPAPPGRIVQSNCELVEECLCWDKSKVTMETLATTDDRTSFRISVTNTNPYAKMLNLKFYEMNDTEEHITLERNIPLSCNKVEEAPLIEFTLVCGTYTAEIMYYCDGFDDRTHCNSHNAGRYTSESMVACKLVQGEPVPRKHVPDITVIALIASFLLVCMIVLAIFILIRVRRGNYRRHLRAQSSDIIPCNNQLDLIRMEMLNPVPFRSESGQIKEEIDSEEEQLLTDTGQKAMLLCHQDCMDLLQRDALNLIVSLLLSLRITIYGYEDSTLFSNWLTLADMAFNDDVTDFIIVASSIDNGTNERDGGWESSQHGLFTNAVMTNIRTRYAEQIQFYVHILCFHESEAHMISNFIEKYKSCLNISCKGQLDKNTFIYCLSKHSEEISSSVLHMDALMFLLARILKRSLKDFEKHISCDANLCLQNLKQVFERDLYVWESKL